MPPIKQPAIALALASIFALAQPLMALSAQVSLSEGTPLRLKLADTISSGKNKEGDTISFTVSDDVLADDNSTVLIKAGAPAWGKIATAQHRGMIGAKGELELTLEGTRTVDGKTVPLRANVSREGQSRLGTSIALSFIFSPLFLLMHGKDARIPAGTSISAYVDRNVLVNIQSTSEQAQNNPDAKTSTSAQIRIQSTDPTSTSSNAVPDYLQKYTTASPTPSSDKPASTTGNEALQALEQLHQQGLLTDAEYASKKKTLEASQKP